MDDEILKGKTVLVVDDTAVSRMLGADILTTSEVIVVEAETGEQALKLAREKPVDAFLLDIRLPDMNGIELCRSLRSMARYRDAPIIFVTAIDQREVLQWAVEAGADDFIQKPLHAMVLRKRLGNLLAKADYLRQVESMTLSLRRHVSPRTEEIAQVFANTGKLPAPRQQEVCVLFSDVRGLLEMGQDLAPELLFEFLSKRLASQAELVYKHGGYIDKYAGDGIMAVFDKGDMALKSCKCALEILDRAADSPGAIGLGIHMGPAMIGNLGTSRHLDYAVVGSTVNLAARLCGLAKRSVVVSKAVRDAVGDDAGYEFLSQRTAKIRGFSDPVTVYDLQRSK